MATLVTARTITAHEPFLREIWTAVGGAPFFTAALRSQGVPVPNGPVFGALRRAKCLSRVARVQGITCWQLDPAVVEYFQQEGQP